MRSQSISIVSILQDEKVLEMLHNNENIVNMTELYTYKWLL